MQASCPARLSTLLLCITHNGQRHKVTAIGMVLPKTLMLPSMAKVSKTHVILSPHLLIVLPDVTVIQHGPLGASTGLGRLDQHESSPVYDDADAEGDIDDEYFNSLQPDSVQHGSHNGPTGLTNGGVAYAAESQFINQPSFGKHGSRDQPIELDDFEDALDDSPEITDNRPGLGSDQPVSVQSYFDTTHRSTIPGTSNAGISASSASARFPQSLQSGGASREPIYPQQVRFTAATRRSDAELAKHNADKKQNKAQEISFEKQGQWWHRMGVKEAAGIDAIFFNRGIKTNLSTVPAVKHFEIADQLRATANSRGSYRESCQLNR